MIMSRIVQARIWFFVASYAVTDKNKLTERDVDNDIPHTVENNDHVCFIVIFPPKLNIEIPTL